jgi:drug/metabolite transporter (DMT)-like permease
LDRKSKYIAIVLFSAFVVAYESVAIEVALNTLGLDIFLVGSMPALIAGLILIAYNPKPTVQMVRSFSRREWVFISILSVFAAMGVILWFDSVGRIGAGKEGILGGGSSEVLLVVVFSMLFLGERLKKLELFGSLLILLGVFVVLVNKDTLSLTLGLGEIEAIISSLFFAGSVVMITRVLRNYAVFPISAMELVFSSLILLAIGLILFPVTWPDAVGWLVLIGLGVFPAINILTYYAGLQAIGASLTSVLFSLSGIFTVVAQISILVFVAVDIQLPENLPLAMVGGIIAVLGVYLLNVRQEPKKLPDSSPPI